MTQLIEITDLSDSRIDAYRDLKRKRDAAPSHSFIVEGRLLVERLLDSQLKTLSILLEPRMLDHFKDRPSNFPIYVMAPSLIQSVAGFPFHRGVMACGRRPTTGDFQPCLNEPSGSELWCGLPNVSDDANLGSIIRSAHSFKLSGVLTSPNFADPFSRRSIRASVGSCFELPIHSGSFDAPSLTTFRQQGVHLVGVTRHKDAIPLPRFTFPPKTMVIPGNEYEGIPPHILQLCDSLIEIPMSPHFDSLNVGVASAIVFYQWSISRTTSSSRRSPSNGTN